jgi:hypothetical protein
MTLTEFLLARIAEDEDVARRLSRATLSGWEADEQEHAVCSMADTIAEGVQFGMETHIARWEPRRVIAECEAKRRIIDLHDGGKDKSRGLWVNRTGCTCGDMPPCRTLAALAMPYADHPDYRVEWRP